MPNIAQSTNRVYLHFCQTIAWDFYSVICDFSFSGTHSPSKQLYSAISDLQFSGNSQK